MLPILWINWIEMYGKKSNEVLRHEYFNNQEINNLYPVVHFLLNKLTNTVTIQFATFY